MPTKLLDAEGLDAMRTDRERWSVDGTTMARTLQFASFRRAFSFMTEVAFVAEQLDHHPEWTNSYGKVSIVLTTHDAGGLTGLDWQLAAAIDDIASHRSGR